MVNWFVGTIRFSSDVDKRVYSVYGGLAVTVNMMDEFYNNICGKFFDCVNVPNLFLSSILIPNCNLVGKIFKTVRREEAMR